MPCRLAFGLTTVRAYNAVDDFSFTNGNPNDVWSYGTLSSVTGGTFTTPSAGDYDLTGFFQRNDSADPQPVNVFVVENGATTLFSDFGFNGNGSQASFSGLANVSLDQGSTLDFIEEGSQPTNDRTGLSLSIDVVPEPALLGLGVAGLSVNLRRRARCTRLGGQCSCVDVRNHINHHTESLPETGALREHAQRNEYATKLGLDGIRRVSADRRGLVRVPSLLPGPRRDRPRASAWSKQDAIFFAKSCPFSSPPSASTRESRSSVIRESNLKASLTT